MFYNVPDFKKKYFNNVSEFDLKNYQQVGSWDKNFTAGQFLNKLFHQASDFEINISNYVGFWVDFFCGLSRFHLFIKTENISAMFQCIVWVCSIELMC